MDHLCFLSCVSHAFASVHCCLAVTCWERAYLLALVGDVYCIFVTCTFPCGILGQVWYLIVSFLIFAVFLTLVVLLLAFPAIGNVWHTSRIKSSLGCM